jgi:hypothetical protein
MESEERMRLPDAAVKFDDVQQCHVLQANALQGALSPNNQSLTVFAPVNDAFNVLAFEVIWLSIASIGQVQLVWLIELIDGDASRCSLQFALKPVVQC